MASLSFSTFLSKIASNFCHADDKSSHSKRLQLLQEDYKPEQAEQPAGEASLIRSGCLCLHTWSKRSRLAARCHFLYSIIHEGRGRDFAEMTGDWSVDFYPNRLRLRGWWTWCKISLLHCHTAGGRERSQQRDGQSDVPVLR